MPRPARPGEAASAVAPTAQSSEPARIPFPPKPKSAPHPQPAPAEDATLEGLREKAPSLERLENAPMVEESDVSLLPKAPARSDEDNGEVNHGIAAGRANGAAHAKTAPRVGVSGRPTRRQQQPTGSIFNSLWPKAQPPMPEAHMAPAVQAPPPPPRLLTAEAGEPPPQTQPATARQETAAAVSILKSGVVEGMAYTLYSDGSIEAQLPGGTLRFGSITELRNHIEQNG